MRYVLSSPFSHNGNEAQRGWFLQLGSQQHQLFMEPWCCQVLQKHIPHVLSRALQGRYYYVHLADEEIETHRAYTTGSHKFLISRTKDLYPVPAGPRVQLFPLPCAVCQIQVTCVQISIVVSLYHYALYPISIIENKSINQSRTGPFMSKPHSLAFSPFHLVSNL